MDCDLGPLRRCSTTTKHIKVAPRSRGSRRDLVTQRPTRVNATNLEPSLAFFFIRRDVHSAKRDCPAVDAPSTTNVFHSPAAARSETRRKTCQQPHRADKPAKNRIANDLVKESPGRGEKVKRENHPGSSGGGGGGGHRSRQPKRPNQTKAKHNQMNHNLWASVAIDGKCNAMLGVRPIKMGKRNQTQKFGDQTGNEQQEEETFRAAFNSINDELVVSWSSSNSDKSRKEQLSRSTAAHRFMQRIRLCHPKWPTMTEDLMHYTTKGPGERTVSLRCFIRRRFLRCPRRGGGGGLVRPSIYVAMWLPP
ncbi:hypothetical protein DAPPUDRAFT_242003 [Daphnia pulex]|uniref:Uncharacterized protein n=1 Tax=Daphnia pulex TaxID=6669 RepID=E9GFL5_DAPPU|nr:hypothetical protein DAPPUDRAFT_242003 [Daphnia pulex]|eukprot:EFX81656.1 hypothetical protein DAPPUDRAFT_242003 [Daphnia pulex]